MQCSTMSDNYLQYYLFLIFIGFLVCGEASPKACLTYPVGSSGTCVPIQNCPRLNKLLQQTRQGQGGHAPTLRLQSMGQISRIKQDIFSSSVCTVQPTPTVCCEPQQVALRFPDPTETYNLPTGCGKGKLQNFIVGGEDSGWWPWIVLLISNGIPFCGGTLIHERFVLTAAHCINTNFVLEKVRAGELNRGTNPDTWKGKTAPPFQEVKVAEVIKNPNYNKGCTKCNDLAIIRLEQPVEINEFVSSICLPLDSEKKRGFSVNHLEGQEATAAGWGVYNQDNIKRPLQPDHLQQVHLAIKTTTTFCQERILLHPPGSIICAGVGDGKDTCRGDSGGPLMLEDNNGLSYLVGVTSHGPLFCGAQGLQGIYMNVHYYLPWILETMRNSSSTS